MASSRSRERTIRKDPEKTAKPYISRPDPHPMCKMSSNLQPRNDRRLDLLSTPRNQDTTL